MAKFDRGFFNNGVDRQEEEVRDLFNRLIKSEIIEETAPTQDADVDEPTVVQDDVLIPQEEEQHVRSVEIEDEERTAPPMDDPAEVIIPALVDDVTPEIPYEEEDLLQEMPPLVLVSQYDEDDSDAEDSFANAEQFVFYNDEDDEEVSEEAPRMRRNPVKVFWHALRDNVPLIGDHPTQVLRKSVIWLAVVLASGLLTYVLYNVWWLPSFTENVYSGVSQDYHPEESGRVPQGGAYPDAMLVSFQLLYDKNPDVRGWLSYHAGGKQDFLNIEYPVMYSGDHAKYLSVDFNGNQNKNGALFFDARVDLSSANSQNDALIIYGHNTASGQMLAGLNALIGNVNNARVASTLSMNTLFANAKYKVFAVVITDESADEERYFPIRRTQFAGDEDFLQYVDQLRARSLFDYPVDVQAGDELVLLSTSTAPNSAKIDNGRLTVVARKVRAGETSAVDTAAIVKNTDVIMPYVWYTAQNEAAHSFYNTKANTVATVTTTAKELG